MIRIDLPIGKATVIMPGTLSMKITPFSNESIKQLTHRETRVHLL